MPAVLSLAYSIAVVIAAWRAPAKGFQAFIGHQVATVEPGGIAARAGLREGDVIVGVDGQPIGGTLDYTFRVLPRSPGEPVTLAITRDGVPHDIAFTLGESPPPWGALAATVLAAMLLVLGLIARIGRPDELAARQFYRTAVVYAVVYVGALSWSRLIVHPVLGVAFLVALFIGPKIALDLSIELTNGVDPAARRWRRIATALAMMLGSTCAAALVVAIVDLQAGRGDRGLLVMVGCVAAQIALIPVHSTIGLWFQVRAHRVANGETRAQLRWLMFGQALGAVPPLVAIPVAIADRDRFLLVTYQPFVIAVAVLWLPRLRARGVAHPARRCRRADQELARLRGRRPARRWRSTVGVVLAAGWTTSAVVGDDAGPWPHLVAGLGALAALFRAAARARRRGWIDRRFFRDRRHYVEGVARRERELGAVARASPSLAREAVERIALEAVRAEARRALCTTRNGGWAIAYSIGAARRCRRPHRRPTAAWRFRCAPPTHVRAASLRG